MYFSQLHVEEIDFSDNRYTLFPSPASTAKKYLEPVEIEALLLFRPPLLLKVESTTYILVSVNEEIEQLLQNKIEQIPALILEENTISQRLILTRLLQHRQLQGTLSCMDQALFLKKSLAVLTEPEVLGLLPLLGLKKKTYNINKQLSLLRLCKTAQLAAHEGRITVRAAFSLLHLQEDEQNFLTELITELRLGGSKQLKLIEQMRELGKRENTKAQQLYVLWQESEEGKEHNGPQKANALFKWLKKRSTPRATAAEQDFKQFITKLNLPQGVSLEHTHSFEDDRIRLIVDFSSKKELARQWPKLDQIL